MSSILTAVTAASVLLSAGGVSTSAIRSAQVVSADKVALAPARAAAKDLCFVPVARAKTAKLADLRAAKVRGACRSANLAPVAAVPVAGMSAAGFSGAVIAAAGLAVVGGVLVAAEATKSPT